MFFAQNIMSTEGLGYGYLYNGYSIAHANFATNGWHIPTSTEITTLLTYLGGNSVAAGKMKETGVDHWYTPNTGATNSSGITLFGCGYRQATGVYININKYVWLVSSTFSNGNPIFTVASYNSAGNLGLYTKDVEVGYTVRLIKDSTTLSHGQTSTMTDYDGNVYDTICIGTQEWTVQNWKCTKLNDGTSLTKVTSDTTWANAGAGDLYYCAYNNDESNV